MKTLMQKWMEAAPPYEELEKEYNEVSAQMKFLNDQLTLLGAALRQLPARQAVDGGEAASPPALPPPQSTEAAELATQENEEDAKPPCHLDMNVFKEGICPDGGEAYGGQVCVSHKNCMAKYRRELRKEKDGE